MSTLYLDYETRSRVDLKRAGVYRYVECPDFSALMCCWSIDGGPINLALGDEACAAIPGLADPGVIKVAHNAAFERVVSSRVLGLPSGQYLCPEPWRDTAITAVEKGWPRSLAGVAKALGGEQKDEAGSALIRLFCQPTRSGGWNDHTTHPRQWLDFIAYCEQDVETLISIDTILGDWPSQAEREAYMADQRMNDRGVVIDLHLAEEAVRCTEENAPLQQAMLLEMTGGLVANPKSPKQMMGWVSSEGLPLKNMQAKTIEAALLSDWITPEQADVLVLRAEAGLTAQSKFVAALLGNCEDGRLRGQFQFFGAHTGRWSGRGVQLQNLPRAGLPSEYHVIEAILALKLGVQVDPNTLKCLVRPLLVGPFTGFDYAAIEARVIAWLAGEQWALDAFAEGRDIYVETATRMSSTTRKYTRFEGKVAVLALGYAGGVRSLRNLGAVGEQKELMAVRDYWRGANPKIVQFWGDLEEAIASGGRVGPHIRIGHERDNLGKCLVVELPSKRRLKYHNLKWERYKVENPETGKMVTKEGWRYADPRSEFGRIGTYGGRMAENVTQAVARDIMAEAMVRLDHAGYPVVGTVHDEVIIEGAHDLDVVHDLFVQSPSWAAGLPIAAEGGWMNRYAK